MPPKICPHPNPHMERGLCRCDYVKDFENGKLSWIIWGDPKCNHIYPHKRNIDGNLSTPRGEGDMEMEQRYLKMLAWNTGVMWPQAYTCWQTPEAGRGKERFSFRASRGNVAPVMP